VCEQEQGVEEEGRRCRVGLAYSCSDFFGGNNHSVLNFRFDMIVVFTINYFLVGDNVSVDSEMFLITNFINFKIKSTQSFKNTHINMMCVYILIHLC
jgi:hypothetical protein